MALYSIESEQSLGISHSGEVTVNGESAVELSDEEVDILVRLIKEKNSTDVEELDLENLYPAIYSKLDEAYYDMAYNAEEIHWLWEGYYNHYFEYDEDKLMNYCEKISAFPLSSNPRNISTKTNLKTTRNLRIHMKMRFMKKRTESSPSGSMTTSKVSPTMKPADSSMTTWKQTSIWTTLTIRLKYQQPSSKRHRNKTATIIPSHFWKYEGKCLSL